MTWIGCLLVAFGPLVGSAQEMPRTVVGNGGTYFQSLTFGSLNWTVGEVATSRFTSSELSIEEGFHRATYDLIVSTDEFFPKDWQVSVYPNPSTEWITLSLPSYVNAQAELWSVSGQRLQVYGAVNDQQLLDVSTWPEGAYVLRLISEERQYSIRLMKVRH